MMPYEETRIRKKNKYIIGSAIGIVVLILAYGPAVFGHGGKGYEADRNYGIQEEVAKKEDEKFNLPVELPDGQMDAYEKGTRRLSDGFSDMDLEKGLKDIFPDAAGNWSERKDVLSCPSWAEPAKVITVSDGDTIFVELMNGEKRHVRLLEVNTPESGKAEAAGYAKATDYGEMASAFTKKTVYDMSPSGEEVILYLSKDKSESPSDTDKYGRLLRIVWLENPSEEAFDNQEEIKRSTLQGVLLSEGMAEAVYYDDFGYKDIFDEIENEARICGKGLWAYGEEAFEKEEI